MTKKGSLQFPSIHLVLDYMFFIYQCRVKELSISHKYKQDITENKSYLVSFVPFYIINFFPFLNFEIQHSLIHHL